MFSNRLAWTIIGGCGTVRRSAASRNGLGGPELVGPAHREDRLRLFDPFAHPIRTRRSSWPSTGSFGDGGSRDRARHAAGRPPRTTLRHRPSLCAPLRQGQACRLGAENRPHRSGVGRVAKQGAGAAIDPGARGAKGGPARNMRGPSGERLRAPLIRRTTERRRMPACGGCSST